MIFQIYDLYFIAYNELPVKLFIMAMYTYDMQFYFNINTTYMFKNKGVFKKIDRYIFHPFLASRYMQNRATICT